MLYLGETAGNYSDVSSLDDAKHCIIEELGDKCYLDNFNRNFSSAEF